ncbi:MAG: tetratricopeptide repeat protein [Thermoanaerobaculia bacterium]|nr:tetratricopeptide repeat protein [Thermoanaerobaculia bacterium]
MMHRRFLLGPLCLGLALTALLAAPAAALDLKPSVVQERYRRVLATLSSGTQSEAMEQLFALETDAVPDTAGSIQLERFWRLKLRVIRDLLQNGKLDQLVPIVVLHHDAFQMYRERKKPLLAAHSRTMATELANILADRADGNPQVRVFSGWVLTSFGSYLQESSAVSGSAALFDRALAVSPGNRSALLGLAAAHEKYGEYELAVPILERAVKADAGDFHARLRLALCLLRSGETEAAVRHLTRLQIEGTTEWIRSLAYQEHAKLLEADGEIAAAETLLREAVEALPEEQEPRIQLAALLDTRGRPKEAVAVLAGLRPAPEGRRSPRFLYDQWPREGVEEGRAKLRAMMQERLDLLAAALRSLPAEGVGP